MRAAVIGAGFAGLINAVKLLRSGVEVDIYEEHDRVGYPKHCTGIVSRRTAALIGNAAAESVEAEYERLVLRSRGLRLAVRAGTVKLDRVRLERLLLEEARSLGAGARLGERVLSVDPESGELELEDGKRPGGYDIIILAEGLHGRLRRSSLSVRWAPTTSMGVNLEAACPSNGTLEVVEAREAWFAWRVPTRRGLVVGALGPRPGGAMREARALLEESGCREAPEVYGGRVIHGPPMPPRLAVRGRLVIVGDAAGLTKPLTGGGLYPNALLAEIASRAVRSGQDPRRAYEGAYRAVYRRLRRQYKSARAALQGGLLWPAVRSLAASYRGELELDYDEHERALASIMRRLGPRAVLAGVRLLLSAPRAVLWLPYVLAP